MVHNEFNILPALDFSGPKAQPVKFQSEDQRRYDVLTTKISSKTIKNEMRAEKKAILAKELENKNAMFKIFKFFATIFLMRPVIELFNPNMFSTKYLENKIQKTENKIESYKNALRVMVDKANEPVSAS